jgi:hypothetical protein
MSKFVPMYDLDSLSEDQKQQYYLSACEYLGLPPELNVLSFKLMDMGDGARRLVLYAKKGATDIIRKNLGISVTGLKKEPGAGEVTWIATGQNKEGRTEMSSGTKSLEGLRGKMLEDAIAWAQTKALRRMTLQFAGGGILDESEIESSSATANINQAPNLAQAAAQPIAQPNAAPGQVSKDFPPEARLVPTPAQVENARRRKRETVSFDKPFVLEPVAEKIEQPVQIHVSEAPQAPKTSNSTSYTEAKKELSVVDFVIFPDAKQVGIYRDKLFVYANEILPKAGMQPSEIGGGTAMKLKKFASKRYDSKQLTIAQWEDLFIYLDTVIKEKGASVLVKIIDAVADAQ